MDYEKIENLAKLSKEGDAGAKEELMREFTPFILNLSKKSYVNGYEFEDLKSECYAVLFKCVEAYDPNKHRFIAYSVNAIKNSINNLIRNSIRREHGEGPSALVLENNLEHILFCDRNSAEDKLYKTAFKIKLKIIINELSFQEQDLIKYVFFKGYTLKRYASFRGIAYYKAVYMKEKVLKELKND